MGESASHVSSAELDCLLEEVKSSSPGGALGVCGPDSVSWKINRESALFLAAGRAALLQLAHPWVAAAIAQHSRTLHDPIGRFHQTFRIIFAMMFGSLDQAMAAARHLHRRHDAIQGRLPDAAGRFPLDSPYRANELSALQWVYATLVDSALLAYEMVLPRLEESEREEYYTESWKTAALFGIPRDSLPPDWRRFELYMESMLQSDSLAVTAATRLMAQQLQTGAGLRLRPPAWYNALTLQLLPPRLRHEFGFTYGDREQHSAERALTWIRHIYPHLPAVIRFVGPYNEVRSRLSGRTRPSLPVRFSNRLWTGQPSLFEAP
jgi:uncharacterized protein (DUF2236 family)